ncbi:MAG: hypothetical protein K0U12_04835, partial [Gammaproteobacteria bacterium]|nr:hypothetical protein [Gammaproteobacteria bacterium]
MRRRFLSDDIEKAILAGDVNSFKKIYVGFRGSFGKDCLSTGQIAYWFWLSILDNRPDAQFQAPRDIALRTDNNACFFFLLSEFAEKVFTTRLIGSVNIKIDNGGYEELNDPETILSLAFSKFEKSSGITYCFKIGSILLRIGGTLLKVKLGSNLFDFAAQENNAVALRSMVESYS